MQVWRWLLESASPDQNSRTETSNVMAEPFECINDAGAAVGKSLQAQSGGWYGVWGNVGEGSSEVLQLKFSR
jgi:hypothetical protein